MVGAMTLPPSPFPWLRRIAVCDFSFLPIVAPHMTFPHDEINFFFPFGVLVSVSFSSPSQHYLAMLI